MMLYIIHFKQNFLDAGKKNGNKIENGLNMFFFRDKQAFNIWHKVEPEINEELMEFLKN